MDRRLSNKATAELVELAQSLIRLDTVNPPGHEREAAAALGSYLEGRGVNVDVRDLGSGRANLVATVAGSGAGRSLALAGHLDTVPANAAEWTVDPWGGVVKDDLLFGRGACDMKGSVAAMAVALACIAVAEPLDGDVVLVATAGEETDSYGAYSLAEQGVLDAVDGILVGEPTRLELGVCHKGLLWVEVEVEGKAAHGSQPDQGVNAIRRLIEWLEPFADLERLVKGTRHERLGSGSVSLNMLTGGTASNIVPASARATLDFRTVPGIEHEAILDALRSRAPTACLNVLRDSVPVSAPEDSDLVRATVVAVQQVTGVDAKLRGLPYVTDGSAFSQFSNASIVVVGPGDERVAHTKDESVAISELIRAAELYQEIARTFCGPVYEALAPSAGSSRPQTGGER